MAAERVAERPAPPQHLAHIYDAMKRTWDPPPPVEEVKRAPVGTKLYSTPPTGTRWEAGRLFWDVVPGRAVAFVHGFVWAYNGHRKGSTAMVDLIEENGRELRKVHVPSLTLSRDLALWQGRWVAVHILRDGQRRPWRAVPVSDGPWAARAAELNRAG